LKGREQQGEGALKMEPDGVDGDREDVYSPQVVRK
jgi:hypothetical protein